MGLNIHKHFCDDGYSFVEGMCYYCLQAKKIEQKVIESNHKRRVALSEFKKTIPSIYKKASLDGIHSSSAEKIRKWAFSDNPILLFWSETPGTGKTWTSYAIAQYFIQNISSAKFISFPDFCCELRNMVSSGKNVDQHITTLRSTSGLLIIDDIGAEKGSDYAIQELYRITDYREKWALKTLITTNLNPAEISKRFQPRLASRITGGLTFEYKGKDRRKQ